jgi:gamma-glutamyltranspeptidase/glutathione hydrolase
MDQAVEVLAGNFLTRRRRARGAGSGRDLRSEGSRRNVRKLDAERAALKAGKSRKQAIYAAYDRFYKGDIARELVRGVREDGGLFTLEDLANWKVHIEEPVKTSYKGIDVYKLPQWQQGPAMLQALNILENTDVKGMGYNSPKYIHAVYQTLSLSFADRDFYYGDPYFAPEEPMKGLLSKEYAKQRFAQIDWAKNDPTIKPGDPYPFQAGTNPFAALLAAWSPKNFSPPDTSRAQPQIPQVDSAFYESFHAGTTSIESADEEGWVVSVTPSGGWNPAVIGHGHWAQPARAELRHRSERRPFNVIGRQRPRVTLTPTLALKDGAPTRVCRARWRFTDRICAVFQRGGVGMSAQAVEAEHQQLPDAVELGAHEACLTHGGGDFFPSPPREALRRRDMVPVDGRQDPQRILFDRKHGTMGGPSHHGED